MHLKECKERLHTDLEFSDYLIYPAEFSEIRAGIESWLREALVAPFSYEGVIEGGAFKAFGQDMVVMAEHGLSERVGQVGQARAQADLEGIDKIQDWLKNIASDGDLLVLLSPPGSEEEGFGADGQRRLSFTQLGIAEIENQKRKIRMVSIPEKEISILTHIERIKNIWEEPSFVWRQKTQLTDKGLVSSPLFIPKDKIGNGIEEYLKLQGKSGWGQVEAELENGLALKDDEKALARRKSLIDSIAWQVRRYVDENDASRLNNIGLVARIVMAREAAGKYLNKTSEEILDEYDQIESAMWLKKQYRNKNVIQKIGEWIKPSAEAVVANQIIANLQIQLQNEPEVQEMLMGSSCGGGGLGDLFGEGSNLAKMGLQGSYLEQLASKALGLDKNKKEDTSSETMSCVKCPFCKKIVDAKVTADKITCPSCNSSASRG